MGRSERDPRYLREEPLSPARRSTTAERDSGPHYVVVERSCPRRSVERSATNPPLFSGGALLNVVVQRGILARSGPRRHWPNWHAASISEMERRAKPPSSDAIVDRSPKSESENGSETDADARALRDHPKRGPRAARTCSDGVRLDRLRRSPRLNQVRWRASSVLKRSPPRNRCDDPGRLAFALSSRMRAGATVTGSPCIDPFEGFAVCWAASRLSRRGSRGPRLPSHMVRAARA